MRSNSDTARDCRRHLATFFRNVQDEPARWLTIVSSSNDQHDSLSKLLGLSYKKMYLPLMLHCGLIREAHSKKFKTTSLVPSVETKGCGTQYTWTDFISEYSLNIETSFIYETGNKLRTYFIRVGSFESASERFMIWDQVRGKMKFKYSTIRDRQTPSSYYYYYY